LDADPASNTLSWRWVAGLQTRGKHYLARASNIRDNTLGRFDPRSQLNETALPLHEDGPPAALQPLTPQAPLNEKRVALLLHDDDLHPESLPLAGDVAAVACLQPTPVGDPNSPAALFAAGALKDAAARAQAHFTLSAAPSLPDAAAVAAWARLSSVRAVVTPYAPAGLTQWALVAVEQALAEEGIRLLRIQRGFDARAWPHAKSGFFKFKEGIPKLISEGQLG
jgi:deoxyribodipyrimidine photo-lyase